MKLTFQNKLLLIVSILLTLLSLNSCTKEKPNVSAGNEEFVGTYMVRDLNIVIEEAYIDSIHFTVFEGLRYNLDFYEAAGSQNDVDFCDHGGTLLDFGTPQASFGPDAVNPDKCEANALPRGTFVADFVNHGDTIIISKVVRDNLAIPPYDSIYIFKLLK